MSIRVTPDRYGDPVRTLGQPNASFAGDTGAPDPDLRAVLARANDGGLAYPRALAALCTARLLLPIVVAPPEVADAEGDDHPEMAAVLMQSATGDKGVVVFTGVDLFGAWRPDARPVPCTLDDVAATAVETGSTAVVVDVNGPHPLVIERQVIDELAAGRRLVELPDGQFGWMHLAADAEEQPVAD